MRKNLILSLILVIIILGSGFYLFNLQQEKERIEREAQEVVEAARLAEKIREANIIELQAELNSLTIILEGLEKETAALQKEKRELELGIGVGAMEVLNEEIRKLEQDKIRLEAIIRQHPNRFEQTLRNPTWAELKAFLRTDRTNELVFDDKRFDCSGFAITLFRNARAAGIRTAYVEVVFDTVGHALNKFRTTDKGYVFVDVTGNREGTGQDTVAYIKNGQLFGTIYIGAITDTKIDCGRINLCSDFINPLPTRRHTELFTYPFFQEKVACGDLYKRCLVELNTEIDKFNRRVSNLNESQLRSWIENNTKLFNQLAIDERLVFIETDNRVTNVEVYW